MTKRIEEEENKVKSNQMNDWVAVAHDTMGEFGVCGITTTKEEIEGPTTRVRWSTWPVQECTRVKSLVSFDSIFFLSSSFLSLHLPSPIKKGVFLTERNESTLWVRERMREWDGEGWWCSRWWEEWIVDTSQLWLKKKMAVGDLGWMKE